MRALLFVSTSSFPLACITIMWSPQWSPKGLHHRLLLSHIFIYNPATFRSLSTPSVQLVFSLLLGASRFIICIQAWFNGRLLEFPNHFDRLSVTAWYIFHSDGVQLLLQSYCALPHIRFSSGSLGTYLVSMLFTVQTHFAALCTSICLLLEHYRRAINVALLFFRPSIFLHRCFESLSLCHLPFISTIWYYVYPSLSSSQLFSQSRFRHNSLCW